MTPRAGDVVLVDLGDMPFGNEQGGIRPAIFVYAEGNVALLVPLSSNTKRLRFKATALIESDDSNRLASPSVALIFQMRAVDHRRVLRRVGTLSISHKRAINKVLRSTILM
ncbi:MAG: type II toxin-antitoxin system PemK/MazF family toxin [Patescibacteria group bacterium]